MARQPIARRSYLVGSIACLVGCEPAHPRRRFLGTMERWNDRVQAALFDGARTASPPSRDATTPIDAFPAYKIGLEYPRAPPGWMLEVSGMVERPRRFRIEDLHRLPRTDVRVRHYCVEGWSAVADWHGVTVRAIGEAVGARQDAPYVEFVSFELSPEGAAGSGAHDAKEAPDMQRPKVERVTYTSSWDRPSALHPQTILAYGMNGAPLTTLHGGPLRLYSSVKLGYKMVKWLSAVRFLPEPTGGYWEDMGYEWFAGV